MKIFAFALIGGIMAAGSPASAQEKSGLKTQVVEYRHGNVVLEGYLAWDPAVAGRRPGVMVVHEWKGHGEYVRRRAEQLARLGYLAFAADMYGKGVFAKDHEEAGKLAGTYFNDRKLMRDRAAAGLDVLRKHELCDPARLAAMGYCFGGTTALEMARAGLDLRGVASFHGNLSTPHPEDAKNIKAKVIVFHGLDDGFVGPEVVRAFHDEMKAAKVDYQFVGFSGAVHSFTVKEAGDDNSKGMAYNEKADRRSWAMLEGFLKEIFQ
jgi:dienelactone hydrolase